MTNRQIYGGTLKGRGEVEYRLIDGHSIELLCHGDVDFTGVISDQDSIDFLFWVTQNSGDVTCYRNRHIFEKDDYIYFFLDGSRGLVKIGRSVNPAARLKDFKRLIKPSKIIHQIRVPASFAELVNVEEMLHRKFARHQLFHPLFGGSLEWFAWCDEIRDYIVTTGGCHEAL